MNPSQPSNAPFFVDREIILLTKNGIWIADGTEITHEPTRRLFARSLKKDPDGYRLYIGRETKLIQVEDTAYFVHRIQGDPQKGFILELSDETKEPLNPQSLKYTPGRLTCLIKTGSEEAKFLHIPYFDLLHTLQEDASSYFLEFGSDQNRTRVNLSHKTS